MGQQVKFTLDDKATEIMESISPELRNSAALVAIKMFAKTSVYKNYFCVSCEETDDAEDLGEIDPLSNSSDTVASSSNAPSAEVVTWDSF